MRTDWLHHEISVEELRSWSSSAQHLSWFHYLFAGIVAYLTTWMIFLGLGCWDCFVLQHGFSIYRPAGDLFPPLSAFCWMTVPAVVNFLILLPFLRFPVRRRIAYVCLLAAWALLLWCVPKVAYR
jgi:hypothetical protein